MTGKMHFLNYIYISIAAAITPWGEMHFCCGRTNSFFPYPLDVPNFSDPHIPVVAREILQRMIRQFAAEYTSKTSSPQDSPSDVQPHADQSLPSPSLLSGAPSSNSVGTRPAHNQNPVLSKLLMAAQDAPLDLTVKKPVAVPCSQGSVTFERPWD